MRSSADPSSSIIHPSILILKWLGEGCDESVSQQAYCWLMSHRWWRSGDVCFAPHFFHPPMAAGCLPNIIPMARLAILIPKTFYSNQLQGDWKFGMPIFVCNFWRIFWVKFWATLFLVLATLAGVSASLLSDRLAMIFQGYHHHTQWGGLFSSSRSQCCCCFSFDKRCVYTGSRFMGGGEMDKDFLLPQMMDLPI